MDKIHNKLLGYSNAYTKWHENPQHKNIHWGATIAVAVVFGLLVLNGIKVWKSTLYDVVVIEFTPRSAVLTLDPQQKSVKVGESFAVNIMLDTDSKPIDGVDIYSLHYDPTILTVVDDQTTRTGIQITPGTLMGATVINTVTAGTGTIKFGQVSDPGSTFTGKGVLATIHFKAKATGSAHLKFDFKLGSTKDTNVAHAGRDQLTSAVDALYTVIAK